MILDGPGSEFVPGLSRRHIDNQGIDTAVSDHTRQLQGPPWIFPSPQTVTSVLNFLKLPHWPPGAPKTFPDIPGPAGIATELHGSHTA